MKKKTLSAYAAGMGSELIAPAQQGSRKPFAKLKKRKDLKSSRPSPPVLDRLLNKTPHQLPEQEVPNEKLEQEPQQDPYYQQSTIDDVIAPEQELKQDPNQSTTQALQEPVSGEQDGEQVSPEQEELQKQQVKNNKDLLKELMQGDGNIGDVFKRMGNLSEQEIQELKSDLGIQPGESREDLLNKVFGNFALNTVKSPVLESSQIENSPTPQLEQSPVDKVIGRGAEIYEPRKLRDMSPQESSSVNFYRKQLASNSSLSEEQRTLYGDGVERVIRNMPEKVSQTILQNVKDIKFFKNKEDLTSQFKSYLSEEKKKKYEKIDVVGFCHSNGLLGLDGESSNINYVEHPSLEPNVDGAYAHEMTHALDMDRSVAASPEWNDIWRQELYQLSESGSPRLSGYARENSLEGLAEFGRLLYGSQIKINLVKKNFPKAYNLFVKNGWIEGEVEEPEGNQLRVPIGGGRI